MKFNYFIFGGILTLITIALIIAYGNKKESRFIISNDYDATINQGLQYEGIDKNQVLSIEQLKDDEELVFFNTNNALGFAYMSKSKGMWSWARTEPIHGFQPSETSSYITYMLEITTTKGHNYYLYLGEIFNPKIDKVTFRSDTITAKIKKINNNTFCFAVVDTELVGTDYFNLGAKAYDNLGKIVE